MGNTSLSSILKALKRVEESGHAEEPLNHPALTRQAPPGRRSWRPGRWFAGRGRAGLIVSVIALAALAAGYYWRSAGSSPPAVVETAKEVRAQLPSPPPAAAPQTAPTPDRRSQSRPSPAPPPPQALESASAPVQAPPPTSRVRPRETAAGPPAEPRPAPARSVPPAPARPETARPSTPRPAEDSLSRIEDSKLKVMAIAWAVEPSRRLAVVNGHIVKEGESVEGFSVTQIRKDDIVVNDGSRSWRVELNLKSQP
jgi:hypothetical protein